MPEVIQISSDITAGDIIDRIRYRLGIGRMKLKVEPGLYSLNKPDETSPVLVTANLKVPLDILRKNLKERAAWILVLDTMGVNVWCAAGKGTFGTEELIHRVQTAGLKEFVKHKKLIVPQLGAPGVKAVAVQRTTGFRVFFGPVAAADLPAYLDNSLKCDADMRLKKFPLSERAELVPLQLIQSWKIFLGVAALVLLREAASKGITGINPSAVIIPALITVISGAVLTPLLLPILPGRAFSVKGAVSGFVVSLAVFGFLPSELSIPAIMQNIVLAAAGSSFIGMWFTGSSTFTSLSGVKKEMKIAVPVQITFAGLSLVLGILPSILQKAGIL